MADRYRNWCTIAYPENISESDLDKFLGNLQVLCFRSPLHLGYGDGVQEERKPHWHLGFIFDGVKSEEQLNELIRYPLNTCKCVQMQSVRGSVRYFLHKDNPEKQQFPHGTTVKAFGGFNPDDYLAPSASEKNRYVGEMEDFIDSNNILEFDDFASYAKSHHFDTWYFLINTGGLYNRIDTKIRSKRNKAKNLVSKLSDDNKRLSSDIESLRSKLLQNEDEYLLLSDSCSRYIAENDSLCKKIDELQSLLNELNGV